MSTILTEQISLNLASHHALIQELGVFAAARGWTVVNNLQNVQWVITSGFIAGSESYLELTSTGEHGAQDMNYRLRGEATGTTANHEWIQLGAFTDGASGFDLTSATHPVQRASGGTPNWNLHRHSSSNPNPIPKTFFYGNDHFLFVVIQLDNTTVSFLEFGSHKVIDPAETHMLQAGILHTTLSTTFHWFNRNHNNPMDIVDEAFYGDGRRLDQSDIDWNIRGSSNNFTISGAPWRYGKGILNAKNDWNNNTVRPVHFPLLSVAFDNTDGRRRPVAESYVARVRTEDLQLGALVDYGGKTFRVFPNVRQGERVHGLAVRVA